MLNLDTKVIPLRGELPYHTIVCHISKPKSQAIIITSITEKEENELDAGRNITIVRGNKSFTISPNNVECYGIIDFSDDSEDMDILADFNWLGSLHFCGIKVPANYDYENDCVYSDSKHIKWYDTTKPEVVAQYSHGLINKPKRCVIFKYLF